jgi:type IV secretion system protein VirB2
VIGYVPQGKNKRDETVTDTRHFSRIRVAAALLLFAAMLAAPDVSFAQESPFLTGAESLQSNILAWATPIAVILVMVLGFMAMSNRISWGWPIGAIIGIAVIFGAPQIVTWIRGMFAV